MPRGAGGTGGVGFAASRRAKKNQAGHRGVARSRVLFYFALRPFLWRA
jgi:hypothetical protein